MNTPINPFQPISVSEAHLLVELELFIDLVRTNRISIADFKHQLVDYLNCFNQVYKPEFEYSARLKQFAYLKLEVDDLLGLDFGYIDYQCLHQLNDSVILDAYQILQQGEALIGQESFKRQQKRSDNINSVVPYVKSLLAHYSRLLVVRVDLKYKAEFCPLVNIVHFHSDMARLLGIIGQRRQCFVEVEGYIWCLEQGDINGGYHCHLLLLFSGKAHQQAWHMASQIGTLWHEITEHQGHYFNCQDIERMKWLESKGTNGLGMVHRDDYQKQSSVLNAASYLAKEEQPLRVKLSAGMRTFGKGSFATRSRRGVDETLYSQYKELRDDL